MYIDLEDNKYFLGENFTLHGSIVKTKQFFWNLVLSNELCIKFSLKLWNLVKIPLDFFKMWNLAIFP